MEVALISERSGDGTKRRIAALRPRFKVSLRDSVRKRKGGSRLGVIYVEFTPVHAGDWGRPVRELELV